MKHRSGWYDNGRKLHYFDNDEAMSICGQLRMEPSCKRLPSADLKSGGVCKLCRQMLKIGEYVERHR